MKITENNVVQQLQKRNEEALYYVIDHYGGLIKSIVNRHLYQFQHIHEECMDDILLGIWHNIDSFNPEKNSLKNWIAAISKYKAIDYKRMHVKFLIVDEIVLTPASTTLHFQMLSEEEYDFEYDVHFIVEDETGKKYGPTSATTSGRNSHIRFGVLDEKVTELTITPYLISGKEGKEKTDYYEVLTDEAFEVELN